MPTVFVIAQDWPLRAGVRAELREIGIEALGMESVAEAEEAMAGGTLPEAVVLDATTKDAAHPALEALARRVPVILVASRMESRPAVQAAAVVWRPVRVGEVVQRVRDALQGRSV